MTVQGSVRFLAMTVPGGRVTHEERRPRALWPLVVLMGSLSLGGFIGGLSLIRDRTGHDLGAELSWLEKTPVHDFFLPGLFLLGVYGVGGLLLIVGLLWRPSPRRLSTIDSGFGHRWAWVGTIAMGMTLILWILYEFVIFSDTMVLQPILIGFGVLMVAIPLLPSMRRHYATSRASGESDRQLDGRV